MKEKIKEIKVNERGFPEPLVANCFRCHQNFSIKWNSGIRMHSQKNYWNYWIDENWNSKKMSRRSESERGEKLCDGCLKDFYLNNKVEFLNTVKNKRKRQTLRSYIYHSLL